MSLINVDKIDPQSGTALEVGTSGDTVTVPSGVTLTTTNATVNLPATVGGLGTGIDVTSQITGVVPAANLGTGTASSSTVLYGDGTFKAEPGGVNTPSFHATMSADQTGAANNTFTKITFDTETWDTASTYNTSTYRWTPGTAAKYVIHGQVDLRDNGANEDLQQKTIAIYKNGSVFRTAQLKMSSGDYIAGNAVQTMSITEVLDLGASDYVEIFAKAYNKVWDCEADNSDFYGYKIIE